MNSADAALVMELRDAFLSEGDSLFDEFRDCLGRMRGNLRDALNGMRKISHTMKGNAQAIGFIHFAKLLDEFEDALHHVVVLADKGEQVPENAIVRLENAVAGCVSGFETYVIELRSGSADSSRLREIRENHIHTLAAWGLENDESDWGMGSDEADEEPVRVGNAGEPTAPRQSSAGVRLEVVRSHEEAPAAKNAVQPDAAEALKDNEQYLLLRFRARKFAIPLGQVIEIFEARPWNPLPVPRHGVLGLMNRHGRVLPVVDFLSLLGMKSMTSNEMSGMSIVVCQSGERQFGFPVEEVLRITTISRAQMQDANRLEFRRDTKAVSHMVILDSAETALIVDSERLGV